MALKYTLFMLVVVTAAVVVEGKPQKKLVNQANLMKRSVDNHQTPLGNTLDNLLSMELVDVKRTVEDTKNNKILDSFKLKKKSLPWDSIDKAPFPSWLKVDKKKAIALFKEKVNKLKESGYTLAGFRSNTGTTVSPTQAIDSNEDIDNIILQEMSNKHLQSQMEVKDKSTVDRFIDALRAVAEKEMALKSQTKRETHNSHENGLAAGCKDLQPDCKSYKYFCNTFKKEMKENCAATCNFCSEDAKTCEPDIGIKERCLIIKKIGWCEQPTAQTLCKATCECENCVNSLHGCCWDKKTLRDDPTGSNCPECKDKYYSTVCKMFEHDCQSETEASKKWMKKNCMKTCGYCTRDMTKPIKSQHQISNNCKDVEEQREFCPVWKNAGWCDKKREIMTSYCGKTCYDCNFTDHSQNN